MALTAWEKSHNITIDCYACNGSSSIHTMAHICNSIGKHNTGLNLIVIQQISLSHSATSSRKHLQKFNAATAITQ